MTATTQPGITLGEEKQGPSIDEQIEMLLNAWRLADMEAPVGPILASLIRLREIEGKLREPTPEMIDVGFDAAGKQYSPDPTDDGLELTLAVWKAMSAILLRGKP